ncbi:hypothetical protein ACFORG_12680 [Lutimaribacter marinistellae]|uniref:Ca2+-binding protein, RTX toxin-related n=1 Tax=Lutimaribacter marinistellae TaxID=1820329 RepID=A0ABV7THU6_9RHOB
MPATPDVWLSKFQANTQDVGISGNSQDEPVIIQLTNGNIVILWRDTADAEPAVDSGDDIVGQIFDPLGNRIGSEFVANGLVTGNERSFDAAALESGDFVLAYEAEEFGGDTKIVATQWTTTDTGAGSSLTLFLAGPADTGDEVRQPSVTGLAGGDYAVAYEAFDASDTVAAYGLETIIVSPSDSSPVGPSIQRIGGYDDPSFDTALATLNNGNFVAVTELSSGATETITFRILAADGTTVTGATLADSSFTGDTFSDPHVAALVTGGFVVTWVRTVGSDTRVQFAIFDNLGNQTKSTTDVVSGGTVFSNEPRVMALADTGFVIAWDDDTATNSLMFQRFDASGNAVGSLVVVNSANVELDTAGVGLADGRFIIGWTESQSLNNDIKAAIYDPRDAANTSGVYSPVERIVGTIGDDSIIAGTDDQVDGWTGNDTIRDSAVAETLNGGDGDDSIVVFSEIDADRFDGGDDTDTIDWSQSSEIGATFSLLDGLAVDSDGNSEVMIGFENLIGTFNADEIIGDDGPNLLDGNGGDDFIRGNGGDDTLLGSFRDDTLEGGAGADELIGGTGDDTITYENAPGAVTMNLLTGLGTQGDALGDTAIGPFRGLTGSAFDDRLTGDLTANLIRGGDGDDTIRGESGDDTIEGGSGNDSLDGGFGTNTLSYANSVDSVEVLLGSGFTYERAVGSGLLVSVDMYDPGDFRGLLGSAFDDTLTGSNDPDEIRGGDGDDNIAAFDGDDDLFGDGGDDTFYWFVGNGDDTVNGGTHGLRGDLLDVSAFDQFTDQTVVSLAEGSDPGEHRLTVISLSSIVETAEIDFFGIEAVRVHLGDGSDVFTTSALQAVDLRGEDGADVIVGGGGDDTINGGAGADILDGGGGTNTLAFSGALGVTVNLATGQSSQSDAAGDYFTNFTHLSGSDDDDDLTGDAQDNMIDGDDGEDLIRGGEGNDTLTGGGGDDEIHGGSGDADRAVFRGDLDQFRIEVQPETGSDPRALIVHDLGAEEVDTIHEDVELLQFDDGLFSFGSLAADGRLIRGETLEQGFGNRFGRNLNKPGEASFAFETTSGAHDVLLDLAGFDIDTGNEVELLLNGVSLGNLGAGSNEASTEYSLTLPASAVEEGDNLLVFRQIGNPGFLWGVENLRVATRTDLDLTRGVADATILGNQVGAAADITDGSALVGFNGTDSDLRLDLTGIDIDFGGDEVEVFLNGTSLGLLAGTPDNGTGPSSFVIPAAQQLAGENLLRFEQTRNDAFKWGISDLRVAQPTDFDLVPGITETGAYGNAFEGSLSLDGIVTGGFQNTGGDVVLTLSGFDIDFDDEVELFLNGTPVAKLPEGANQAETLYRFAIDAAAQTPEQNVLTALQIRDTAFAWGVTDIRIDAPDVQLLTGQTDPGEYGNNYNGALAPEGEVTMTFAGSPEPMRLDVTGFDIDFIDEVEVRLNSTVLGNLGITPDDGTAPNSFDLPAAALLPGENVLTFAQMRDTGFKWGVTDVQVRSLTDFSLIGTTPETGRFGNDFNGSADPDGKVTGTFQSDGGATVLRVDGFDIDFADEVQVGLNGSALRFLEPGPNNATASYVLGMSGDLVNAGENVLAFTQERDPGFRWGITNVSMTPADMLLTLETVERGAYGNSFLGTSSTSVLALFDTDIDAIRLDVRGFDIDLANEVEILLNDKSQGFFSGGPANNDTLADFSLVFDPDDLRIGQGNVLELRQAIDPGFAWGVTEIELSATAI